MNFTIRFDRSNLHNDLEIIRNQRLNMGTQDEHTITVKLTQASDLSVIAKGRNLWITGYQKNGSIISFERDPNYAESDNGCTLMFDQIEGLLTQFHSQNYQDTDFIRSAQGRDSYIMCVFVASELVRNEFLERVLLYGEAAGMPLCWRDYKLLYTNWQHTSQLLYAIDSGDWYPAIHVKDLKTLFVRLYNSKKPLKQEVINIYQKGLDALKI